MKKPFFYSLISLLLFPKLVAAQDSPHLNRVTNQVLLAQNNSSDSQPVHFKTKNQAYLEIDQIVRQLMIKQQIVGLAVGIVHNKETGFLKGYGYADLGAKIPVDVNQTLFRWASLSKPVTAIITAQLVKAGIVNWDFPIQTWFKTYQMPKFYLLDCATNAQTSTLNDYRFPCDRGYTEVPLPPSSKITLRTLLGHTAGIIGYDNPRGSAEPNTSYLDSQRNQSILRWGLENLLTKPLLAIPSREYHYTTFGYNLAGVVLEEASGQPYPQLLQTYINNPANLNTLQPDYQWETIPNRVIGYRREKGQIIQDRLTDVSWKMAGGGLMSTPKDLTTFCGALMDNTLLDERAKRTLWTEQITSKGKTTEYGLGFGIGRWKNHVYIGHSGSQENTKTRLEFYPKDNLCIVIMSNTNTTKTNSFVKAIAQTILDP